MSVVSFPDIISVILGQSWNGWQGLSEYDIVYLYKISSDANNAYYSENGTETPDNTTNRIRVRFSSGTNAIAAYLFVAQYDYEIWLSAGSFVASTPSTLSTPILSDYVFKNLWDMWGNTTGYPSVNFSGYANTNYALTASGTLYNDNVFTSLNIYVPPNYIEIAAIINGVSTIEVDRLNSIASYSCIISSASNIQITANAVYSLSVDINSATSLLQSLSVICGLSPVVNSSSTISGLLSFNQYVGCSLVDSSEISAEVGIIIDVQSLSIVGNSTITTSDLYRIIGYESSVVGESSISSSCNTTYLINGIIDGVSTIGAFVYSTIDLSCNIVPISGINAHLSFIIYMGASLVSTSEIVVDLDVIIVVQLGATIEGVSSIINETSLIVGIVSNIDSDSVISSAIDVISGFDDFITLFIQGSYPFASNYIPLFLQQSTLSTSDYIPLLIIGDGVTDGALPLSSSITLYIGRNDYVLDIIPLFINGGADINDDIPLFVEGSIGVNSNIPLVIPNVVDTVTQTLKLYTHGY